MDYKHVGTHLYLGISLKDQSRLLSDFDTLLDSGFPVIAGNTEDRYMIPFTELGEWIRILYLKEKKRGEFIVSSEIKDVDFEICTKDGKVYRELTEKEKDCLRVGKDITHKGSRYCTYTIQFFNDGRPRVSIYIMGCQYEHILMEEFQNVIDYPDIGTILDNIADLVFRSNSGYSYDMIFDMYNKGYLSLTESQLEWWDDIKKYAAASYPISRDN